MASDNETVQENINAGHDVVGRDKHEHNHYYNTANEAKFLEKLFIEYQNNTDTDLGEHRGWIEALDYYFKCTPEEAKRDLEKKLLDAGYNENQVRDASEYKTELWKRLEKFRFSPSAQSIFAHLLGKTFALFKVEIYPLIKQGWSKDEIDKIVLNKVIEPIINSIPVIDHDIFITHPVLYGMIYFLTGHCFLEWENV